MRIKSLTALVRQTAEKLYILFSLLSQDFYKFFRHCLDFVGNTGFEETTPGDVRLFFKTKGRTSTEKTFWRSRWKTFSNECGFLLPKVINVLHYCANCSWQLRHQNRMREDRRQEFFHNSMTEKERSDCVSMFLSAFVFSIQNYLCRVFCFRKREKSWLKAAGFFPVSSKLNFLFEKRL